MVTPKTIFFYATTSFPLAAAFITLQIIIPTHYAELTSLSLTTIGGIVLVARLWDTITDPIVGMLSDKTPQRFGRRRIWVLASIPLVCLSTWMLFNPSEHASSTYLLFWTLAVYVSGTMAIVPYTAWGAELTQDYHRRNQIAGARTALGLAGTLVAITIPALSGEAYTTTLNDTLVTITSMVIVVLILAGILLFKVPDNHPIDLPSNQLIPALQLLIKPSPFRQLILSFLSNSIANAIAATLFLFYVTYILKSEGMAGAFLFVYFICAAISIPFWVKLSKKFGKHRTWFYSIIIACSFFVWTPFLGQGDIWLFMAIVIGTGLTSGCDLVIPSSMNGDVIEWDAANNGHKRPGLFFALWGTTTKLAFGFAVGLSFPLLDWFGFEAGAENSTEALSALAWLYGLPCIIFKLLALLGMRNYPLSEDNYNALMESKSQNAAAAKENDTTDIPKATL